MLEQVSRVAFRYGKFSQDIQAMHAHLNGSGCAINLACHGQCDRNLTSAEVCNRVRGRQQERSGASRPATEFYASVACLTTLDKALGPIHSRKAGALNCIHPGVPGRRHAGRCTAVCAFKQHYARCIVDRKLAPHCRNPVSCHVRCFFRNPTSSQRNITQHSMQPILLCLSFTSEDLLVQVGHLARAEFIPNLSSAVP